MTFSIVAYDGEVSPPEWGVAVASKFLAVGAAVPAARAGVGALATQAFANLGYRHDGLARLERGDDAEQVCAALTGADDQREHRQLGVVDAQGRAATFTGSECFDWAGGRAGEGYCCQGNILTGAEVVDAMCDAFEAARGDLATRLLSALEAGDRAGGDRRGRQSAALLVVREGGGYGGGSDVSVDLRVDDHQEPIPELQRLFALHRLLFPRSEDLRFIPIDDDLAAELRDLLERAGYEPGAEAGYDEGLKKALFEYVGTENLEERWSEEAQIDEEVLRFVRAHAPRASRA